MARTLGINPIPNAQAQYYITEYKKGGHSEYEMAVLEEHIWASIPADMRHGVDRNKWLHSLLGSGINRMQNRSSLRNKKNAEPLWERVNRDQMPVATALRLYKDATKLHINNNISLPDAIKEILHEYDELPHVAYRHGKPIRQSSSARLPREKKKKRKANKKSKNNARKNWDDLRHAMAAIIRDKLPEDLEPDIENKIWREVESDVKIILDELQGKIHRLHTKKKNNQQITKTASRRQLVAACRVLAMDPPRPGKPVDIAKAKRQKRLLAKEYHPDARNGDDSLVTQYEAVLDAYRTVEWYADQFN